MIAIAWDRPMARPQIDATWLRSAKVAVELDIFNEYFSKARRKLSSADYDAESEILRYGREKVLFEDSQK